MKYRVCLAQCTTVLLVGMAMAMAGTAARAQVAPPPTVTIKPLLKPGGRVDWCPATGLIAFDRAGANGIYELCTCKADGSDIKVISAGLEGLPGKNVGGPTWSPDGKWLVFQAEKATHDTMTAYAPTPGGGMFNDLWALDMATKKARPLRVIPNSSDCGVLHAHFSADGKRLSWSEMYSGPRGGGAREFGWYWLMVADVKAGPDGLSLSNIRKFQPAGPGFYENHGFSPDGKKLIYTTSALTPTVSAMEREDICVYDMAMDQQMRLTQSGYNEHAIFSPDGKQIVWMTNEGIASTGSAFRGTDYWIMNADGSNKRRLTYFNDPTSPMYVPGLTVASDFSWRPDGKAFVAFRQLFAANGAKTEDDVLVELRQ